MQSQAPIAELVLGKKDSSSKKWRPLYGRLKILAQVHLRNGTLSLSFSMPVDARLAAWF